MIASVEGAVGAVGADSLVVEVGGLGYRFTNRLLVGDFDDPALSLAEPLGEGRVQRLWPASAGAGVEHDHDGSRVAPG